MPRRTRSQDDSSSKSRGPRCNGSEDKAITTVASNNNNTMLSAPTAAVTVANDNKAITITYHPDRSVSITGTAAALADCAVSINNTGTTVTTTVTRTTTTATAAATTAAAAAAVARAAPLTDNAAVVERMLLFAPLSATRLAELATVSSTFRDVISSRGTAIFDCWRRSNSRSFKKEFFRVCASGGYEQPARVCGRTRGRRVAVAVGTRRRLAIGSSLSFVPQFLAAGASPNTRGEWNLPVVEEDVRVPVMCVVALTGDIDTLRVLLAAPGARVNEASENGFTALMGAVRGFEDAHLACMEALLAAGADPFATTCADMLDSKSVIEVAEAVENDRAVIVLSTRMGKKDGMTVLEEDLEYLEFVLLGA